MIIYLIIYVRYHIYFESTLIIALKNLLVQQTLFQLYTGERNFKCYHTSLFLFHALFSHKVCLLSSIFISPNLWRNLFYLFLPHFRYGKLYLSPDARIVFSPQI